MSYFINPVEEDRCVFLSHEGEMPPVEFSAARYEAHGVMARRRWNRMVVDVTQLRSIPTPAELFDYAKAIRAGMPTGARVALVVRPDQVQSARLVERIARSKGVFLTYFLDPDKAMAWVKPIKVTRQTIGHHWRRNDAVERGSVPCALAWHCQPARK